MESNFEKNLLAQILESSPECVAVYDNGGNIVFANCAARRVLTYEGDDIIGLPVTQVLPLIDTATLLPILPVNFPTGEICHYFMEALLRNSYGDMIVVDGHITALFGGFSVVIFRDAGEVKRHIKKHKVVPSCMPLSDLVNKEKFTLLLQGVFTLHRQAGESFSILRIDIDNFCKVFETVPREFASEFLQQLTVIIQGKINKKDTLAWFDDDNFALLLKDCSEDDARQVAQRIMREVSDRNFIHAGKTYSLTLSIAALSVTERTEAPTPGAMLEQLEKTVRRIFEEGGNDCKFVELEREGAK